MAFLPENREEIVKENREEIVKENREMRENKTKFLPEIEVKELPSKFISYPENCVIKYRPYTFGEIKKSNQSKLSIRLMFEFMLEGIDTSFDKYNLTLPDFLFISLLRKISTVGESKFTIKCTCPKPKCLTKNTITLSSDDLEFNDIRAPKLPIKAQFKIGEYTFNPLTIGDYFFLIKEKKEDDVSALLSVQACKNNEEEFDKVYRAFFNIVKEDGEILEEVDHYLDHSLNPAIVECKKCGTKIKVELEGGQNFIYPFRTDKKSIRDKLHFG